MTGIDAAVLDLTEWLCRRFQVLTGRTNVWIAVQLTNLSIIVYFVWAAMSFWRAGIATRIGVGLFCAALMYALAQTIFKEPIDTSETQAYRRVAKGLRNPRRVRDALLRVSFLNLSIVLLYPFLWLYNFRPTTAVAAAAVKQAQVVALPTYSLILLTTVILYVMACDPLPPCTSKAREWLRGLVPARLVPAERPAVAWPGPGGRRSDRRRAA